MLCPVSEGSDGYIPYLKACCKVLTCRALKPLDEGGLEAQSMVLFLKTVLLQTQQDYFT